MFVGSVVCGFTSMFFWLITVYWNLVQSKECSNLFIGGSHIQPQVEGHYLLQRHTHNTRVVYKQPCSRYALFMTHGEDGSTKWTIGPHEGSTTHYVMSETTSAYPRDVTFWQSWNESSRAWENDSRLFISCSDVIQFCETFLIRGPDVPTTLWGPYHINVSHNMQPSYIHVERDVHVFYQNDSGCSKWTVGPRTDSQTFFLQTLTESSSLFDNMEMWKIKHADNRFQKTYNVKIECMTELQNKTPSCGKRLEEAPAQPLLLGARSSYPGKWPYTISYRRPDGQHKCGGAVVASNWVITSGHCVSGANTVNETIIVGGYNIDTEEETTNTFRIKATYVHPEFAWVRTPFRLNYDVALIEVDGDISFTSHVQPACLPRQSSEFPYGDTRPASSRSINRTYTSCYMTGWGKQNRNGNVGGELQELPVVQVLNMADCYDKYYASLGPWIKQSRGVCVFGQHAGRMCKGDSGSPMFCDNGGDWTLMGLGGWSLSDCAFYFYNYPSVYTDISVFYDWIIAILYGQNT